MVKPSPYDAAAFGMPAWELTEYSAAALREADGKAGLQTIKVDPLADKSLLRQHGFHYTDTLLATRATALRLRDVTPRLGITVASIAADDALQREQALAICHGAFAHGRFHRDFLLPREGAELRYANWLGQLLDADTVFGLYADGVLSGFIGYVAGQHGASLVLHAVAEQQRGRGLARHWWHLAVHALLVQGFTEISSSISAANVAVLNLYASLGFRFDQPQDVYHRIVP
jgi:ribosomal protein S18 acetylase RimI-like enzyme